MNKHITVDSIKNEVESLFQRNENVIHPSERDYGMITSSDQKYCASIFYRGWYLKSQTLYSQYKWFEHFESNILSQINPSDFDDNGKLIDGSSGVLKVETSRIVIKYAIIENILFLIIGGENRDKFIERGTQIGFEYGTINQAGKTVRSRKLQTWGFLDFICINRKSPRDQRIFEVNLDLYQDYKNRVNFIVSEKISWINYSLNKNKIKKPSTWIEDRSSKWVKQTKNIRDEGIRDFFFNQVKPLQGYQDIIKIYNDQKNCRCIDVDVDADLCLVESIKFGEKGISNNNIDKSARNGIKDLKVINIRDSTKIKHFMSRSDKYLTLKGLKKIQVDNENRGATKIFINRMKSLIRDDIKLSPLVNYGILTVQQCKKCKFEISWGLKNWRGFQRADTFAPDILVTNGLFGSKRKIFAVIQLKGQTREKKRFHVTSIFFQMLELKKYEVDASLKTAMVIIDLNINKSLVTYKWLVNKRLKSVHKSNQLIKLKMFGKRMRYDNEVFLDPLLYRNTRCKKIVKSVYELLISQESNLEEVEKFSLDLITQRIIDAYKSFAEFTSTPPLNADIGGVKFMLMVMKYVDHIQPILKDILKRAVSGKIDNYPLLQTIWNYSIYRQYHANFLKYMKSNTGLAEPYR